MAVARIRQTGFYLTEKIWQRIDRIIPFREYQQI
jgi:uncharacterized membrane protein